jgi:hypothetical protein
MKQKQPTGPPMTLGNMRALGVQRLIASCLKTLAVTQRHAAECYPPGIRATIAQPH